MKNIHVLLTDKPSRLYEFGGKFILTNESSNAFRNQHIYITSDEKVEEKHWALNIGNNEIIYITKIIHKIAYHEPDRGCIRLEDCRKIILTTDQDLIKDGLQPIDDDFLEWFVKNPSCEGVEIEKGKILNQGSYITGNIVTKDYYEIIIPKEESKPLPDVNWQSEIINKVWDEEEPKQKTLEEAKTGYVKSETEFLGVEFILKDGSKQFVSKQETLEEAAENYCSNSHAINEDRASWQDIEFAFKDGAKWQAERMYSEEEVRQAIKKARDISDGKNCFDAEDISGCTEVCTYNWKFNLSEDSIIEQFKNK